MKSLVAASIIALVFLSSCEKEYTCSCREIDKSTGKVNKYWSPKTGTFTKSDAETWCHSSETSGFGIEIKCDLK